MDEEFEGTDGTWEDLGDYEQCDADRNDEEMAEEEMATNASEDCETLLEKMEAEEEEIVNGYDRISASAPPLPEQTGEGLEALIDFNEEMAIMALEGLSGYD